MNHDCFSANIALIRDVWSMNRLQFGRLFSVSEWHIAGHERGRGSVIPPSLLFDLEEMTGIPARELYYNKITRRQIPVHPLPKQVAAELMATEKTPQYKTQNLTQLERIERLERKVFGS